MRSFSFGLVLVVEAGRLVEIRFKRWLQYYSS
jgi:hypothetical protein